MRRDGRISGMGEGGGKEGIEEGKYWEGRGRQGIG